MARNSFRSGRYLIIRVFLYILLAFVLFSISSLPVFSHGIISVYAGEEGSDGGDGGGGDGGDTSGGDTSGGDTGGGDTGGGDGGSGDGGSGDGGGGDGGGGDGGGGDGGGGDTGGGTNPPAPTLKIIDVGIYWAGTGTALGYSTNSSGQIKGTISARGGSFEFDNVVTWNDKRMSQDRNHYSVTWSVDNASIATITSVGLLTARADGVVKVMATVAGSETDTGADRVAYTMIKVEGQGDGRYVDSIGITDEAGAKLDSFFVWQPDLSKDIKQFYALVKVVDPLTGESRTYSTKNGAISKQAPDISDIIWDVGDPAMAVIDDKTGLFRPKVYGGVTVYATSNAGKSGSVLNTVFVQSENPDGAQPDGYFPQNSLTIKAYYELYTPSQFGETAYVINKRYTVAEVEALGTVTQTYTSLGGNGGYYTMTGRGVPLATILNDAGVNMNKATQYNFSSVDSDKMGSKKFIFGTNRYYYPNIDIGSYSGAVQVYPILALESNQRRGGDTNPDYTLLEATRFRLLIGAIPGYNNSEWQRKWIHTIYVIYEGGPPAEIDGGAGGDNAGGDGSTDGGDGSGQTGSGSAGGGGTGANSGKGGNTGDTNDILAGTGGISAIGLTDLSNMVLIEPIQKNPEQAGAGEPAKPKGSYSVFQILSKEDAKNEAVLELENPLKPFAAPVAFTVFVAGCIEMLLWFRRQSKAKSFMATA